MQKVSEGKLLTVAGFAWLFDALDVGLLSFIIAALKSEWQLNTVQMGWLGSISSIGMAVGALFFGILADRIGRRDVLVLTLLLFSIGSGISVLATSFTIFAIIRFFVGAGLGGELPVASTLVSESVAPEKRGRIVVLLESFWAGGWICAALIAYFIIPRFGWRVAALGTALTAVYALYIRWQIHEPVTVAKSERPTLLQNIRAVWSAPYAKATLMLWLLWFAVVFSYYGMFLWLPSVLVLKGYSLLNSFGYVLAMTLAQLPGYFTAAWLIEKWGRKWVLIVYLLGTALSAYYFGNAASLGNLLVSGALLSFFDLGAWGALYAYSPEQYPTAIRGTGTGMAAAFGRIGGIVGPLLVGYLLTAQVSVNAIFAIFTGAIIIGILAVALLGEETRGRVLA
ncbi:MFS transporter [Loigolactobacillus coryniformis]|jgi:putative MFS transporter|uniref:MFS transporter n=1 Tax=Loigolactobacillus coryniformis TaxID=1610 RepID=UPI0023406741|nr:MFS transporter [Loigolactobacillus coryniformis]MDC4185822.1 MFS transporter [Loigolactobacillus coryniformis]MDN5951009.1 MFS transporter [Loigolactobacillus coryniformis]MDN5953003.1 MFS transporter [Loigolactobacillus coryniformis]MDT3392155.1 MFS transporter [Bacillota bacterium]